VTQNDRQQTSEAKSPKGAARSAGAATEGRAGGASGRDRRKRSHRIDLESASAV